MGDPSQGFRLQGMLGHELDAAVRERALEEAAEAHRKVEDRSKDAAPRVRWWRRLLRRPSTG